MRLVLKVGSAVLTGNGKLELTRIRSLVKFIVELKSKYDVILVSSGAVAAGYTELALDKKIVANKQVLASIGQPLMMSKYRKKFKEYNVKVAQVLITEDDLDSRKRTSHARQAIDILLQNGVVPIINENDVTATEELVFGDNDQLSAHVCYHFKADMLVILSDIDGYYDKNPREYNDAKMLKIVNHIPKEELEVSHTPNNEFATGGIVTKLLAANYLINKNKKMYLSSGFDLHNAREFLLNNNHDKGTLFQKSL
jgi:glutamate 5-kinase